MAFRLVLIIMFCFSKAFAFDIVKYNILIENATSFIINAEHQKADSTYKLAFNMMESPFYTDIHNALYNAIDGNRTESAFHYASMIAKLGVGKPYFEKNSQIHNALSRNNKWQGLLSDADRYQKSIHQKYGALLSKIQANKDKIESLLQSYIDNEFKNRETIMLEFKHLAAELMDIFYTHGYLTESQIGVHLLNDTTVGDPVFTDILIANNFYLDTSGNIEYAIDDYFEAILEAQLNKGNISVQYLKKVIEQVSVVNKTASARIDFPSVVTKNKTLMHKNPANFYIKEVEAERALYGLCNYQQYLRKVAYTLQPNANKKYDFGARIFPGEYLSELHDYVAF